MNKEISFSEKMTIKLLDTEFKKVSTGWFSTVITWCIDSKYRKYKRVDKFLKDQIDNPNPRLLRAARVFKQYPYDERIIRILKYVHKRIKYVTDWKQYGMDEKWSEAIEPFERLKGDCDDINSLIYVLARLSGIPSFLLYCVIGDTLTQLHFYCLYFNGFFYSIDGTYEPDFDEIKNRYRFWQLNYYKKVWYVFNEYHSFKPLPGGLQ